MRNIFIRGNKQICFQSKVLFGKELSKKFWEKDLFLRDKIKTEYISFAVSLSTIKILAFLMRWWLRTRSLLSFFSIKFCLILFFQVWGITCINWTHWKYMSFSRRYSSFKVSNFLNWKDSFTNWSTKLILFCESLVKLTIKLSIIIFLLNHRFCERMSEMVSRFVVRYCFQFSKIFL